MRGAYAAAATRVDDDIVDQVKRALGLDVRERRQRVAGAVLAAVGTVGGLGVWVAFG